MAEGRARTDASLDAERATADAALVRTAANIQRKLDVLIARDRVVADQRLTMFRENADAVLAGQRAASSEPSVRVEEERAVADDGMRAERSAADALIDHERRRVDARAGTRRDMRARADVAQGVRRADTNERLQGERSDADAIEADHSDVLAMVTHDLRTPLCGIVLNAEFLAETAANEAARGAADDVTLAAARMGRLLTDLLDVARVDVGSFPLTKRPHDVGAFTSQVHRAFLPTFDARGVSFGIDVPVADIVASFDHDRLMQLISNLLGNAMRFTPPGGTVSVHVESDDEHLVYVVRDDGAGIPADALPHIFERFWQRSDDSRRGLGLGLYLCRVIAQAHGGDITAQSELGVGTTMRVSLPLG